MTTIRAGSLRVLTAAAVVALGAATVMAQGTRDDYARKGRARAQRFSMRACAEATMNILDRVAAARDSSR